MLLCCVDYFMKTLVIRLKSNVFTPHDFYNIMSSVYFLLQESYNKKYVLLIMKNA